MSASFAARFGSRCNACDERIHEGDMARFSEDLIVHADCSDVKPERPMPDPCGRCFMVPSISGECGCE